jgi:rifampicin phosphotransferase
MITYVLQLGDLDATKSLLAGAKGANLGELFAIKEIRVPDGFCVTTEAYKKTTGRNKQIRGLLLKLTQLEASERDKITQISARIRAAIETAPIAKNIISGIKVHLKRLGESNAYAVRSSSTAEDLPAASFAGQQDTYLNICGKEAVLRHVSKCWASLFTDRAVIYRMQNGVDHRNVQMAVVVQKMVIADAAGILFTADPITGNRQVSTIDASFGLGEAVVSGQVNPDSYKVCKGRIIYKNISTKKHLIYGLKDGGTKKREIEPDQQTRQALTNEQIVTLEQIGRKIEAQFGSPQDIEWCLANEAFFIVQSRPITNLYPVPEANDQENRVYVSVGHQQMMTDPIKPLGLSFFLLTTRAPMRKAGGRLYVDITQAMASEESRKKLIEALGKSDPLIKDALNTVAKRKEFIRSPVPDVKLPQVHRAVYTKMTSKQLSKFEKNPGIVTELIEDSQVSMEELIRKIKSKSGVDLFDFILDDLQQLKKILFNPQSLEVILAAMHASTWINKKMMKWLGEKNAADSLSLSAPGNITAAMGLDLLDVADAIRPYPELINFLEHVNNDHFLEELLKFNGGKQGFEAIQLYLRKYGMRCAGEIDITNTRWSEKPINLVPMILTNIKNFKPGESKRKFEHGQQEALKKEQLLLYRLKQLPGGTQKANEAKRMISLIRKLTGYREYPKYAIVNRYFVYKLALLKEAERLLQSKVIHEKEDIFYLSFEEFQEVVRTNISDYKIICKRKEDFKLYQKLTPPRVITSDGEIISGKYRRANLPGGALAGLAVSSGIVEGRARVTEHLEDAWLEKGDILVATFTDPSWTPLFVSITGLVTEVGGLMTHGAVIAREYGLPAVVGVQDATRLIRDGQKIRVNGTDGYIEIL